MRDPEIGVAVTGVGIVTALGADPEAHANWSDRTPPIPDDHTFAPFSVLNHAEVDLTAYVTEAGDRRQMEHWQLLGTHCAGAALAMANFSNPPEAVELSIAANGGGREVKADEAILSEHSSEGAAHNSAMLRRYRPSYFLSQLPNLLAGNIAHILGAGGAARTFMGDERAGVSALVTAIARIQSGRSQAVLAGGVFDASSVDRIVDLAVAGVLRPNVSTPGSQAAFLLLENVELAERRGAKCVAHVSADGPAKKSILSTALSAKTEFRERKTSDLVGFGYEAQFIVQTAIAISGLKDEPVSIQLWHSTHDRSCLRLEHRP